MVVEGEYAPGTLRALVLVDITPRQEAVGVDRIVSFMMERADTGFASLEEVADAIAAYQPHRERPSNLEGLKKNLILGEDGRWRWHWDPMLFNTEQGLHSAKTPGRFTDAARNLGLPTLLVRGKLSDLVSEETAAEFIELVPHASFVDVSDAGHMVAGDRNDRFTDAVVDFLQSLA
jgi:pimeloyl-ACP methyl ester carboxylesterase